MTDRPQEHPELALDRADRALVARLRSHSAPPPLTATRRAEMRRDLDARLERRGLSWAIPAAAATAAVVAWLAVDARQPPVPTPTSAVVATAEADHAGWTEALLLPVDPTDSGDLPRDEILPHSYVVLASYLDR